ncbi:macro domain-containing protein [Natronomonas sp. EA1]|uniref:macro domain-containing protein n=1 Tax=Natronomonas sp. EA1 TaxID=3421655 RepID=UPI003EB695D4
MEFDVIQGDIAAQRADAVVNAANTALEMGGGVAGALRRAAGEDIQAEAREQAPIELGEAVETGGYRLDAEYVIHAATMRPGGGATEESIRDATWNALARADDLGCASLVLPALGCGIAGVPLEEGAPCIFEEIREYEPATLADVRVIAYDAGEFETLKRLADT